jgi:hypothetical protein
LLLFAALGDEDSWELLEVEDEAALVERREGQARAEREADDAWGRRIGRVGAQVGGGHHPKRQRPVAVPEVVAGAGAQDPERLAARCAS